MNEELIADLKQFILATVSQATADIRADVSALTADVTQVRTEVSELRTEVRELKADVKAVDGRLDDVQSAIAQALTVNNESIDSQLADHNKRLMRLEHSPAA